MATAANNKKGSNIKGGGKGGVRIKSGFEGKNYDRNNFLVYYQVTNPSANEPFRLSGFIFDLARKTEGIIIANDSITKVNKIRIDNNEFYYPQDDVGARIIRTDGPIYGVVDNNIFHNDDSESQRIFSNYDFSAGQYAWQYYTFDFGTADNIYYEDNTIYTRNIIASNGVGGRYAFRYNTIIVNRSNPITVYLLDAHGNMGTGGNWGQMGIEFYENNIYYNNNGTCLFDLRGGKALVYNNRFYNCAWSPYFSVREEYHDSLNPPAKNLISGQPQYPSECYVFGMTNNGNKLILGASIGATIDYGGDEGIVPREDVHFFNEKISFDGSSGVGIGPIAKRPIYGAKDGVAWWATDEGKLYRWHNAKWELYYVPYPYPHPLRSTLND